MLARSCWLKACESRLALTLHLNWSKDNRRFCGSSKPPFCFADFLADFSWSSSFGGSFWKTIYLCGFTELNESYE
jgi:hypothetical protein